MSDLLVLLSFPPDQGKKCKSFKEDLCACRSPHGADCCGSSSKGLSRARPVFSQELPVISGHGTGLEGNSDSAV